MSEIQITPKSKLLSVRISARSDFERSSLKISNKLVRKPNVRNRSFGLKPNKFGPNCPKTKCFMSEIWTMSEIRTFFPIGPYDCSDFRHSKNLKAELFCSDVGQCPNTKPSGIRPKVEITGTELVQILDVDCIWNFIYKRRETRLVGVWWKRNCRVMSQVVFTCKWVSLGLRIYYFPSKLTNNFPHNWCWNFVEPV